MIGVALSKKLPQPLRTVGQNSQLGQAGRESWSHRKHSPDQSYSERQIYQAALDRLAREFAVIEKIDEITAAQRLEQMLRAA